MRKFALYVICGGVGVLTDLTIYSFMIERDVGYQFANFIGYASGTVISFLLNRHFTFQTYDRALQRLGLFLLTALLGYLMSSALLWLFIGKFFIHPIVAKLATLFFVLVFQFSINKAITFRPQTR